MEAKFAKRGRNPRSGSRSRILSLIARTTSGKNGEDGKIFPTLYKLMGFGLFLVLLLLFKLELESVKWKLSEWKASFSSLLSLARNK